MLKKQAFDFWKTYIEFLTKGIIDVPMPNPAIEFLADVKAGKYDEISDKEYDELLNSTAELASFWKKKRKATVGEIVREALIHMNLSLSETEKLAQILAEASTCKTYSLVSSAMRSICVCVTERRRSYRRFCSSTLRRLASRLYS